jgi:hypothetical protein
VSVTVGTWFLSMARAERAVKGKGTTRYVGTYVVKRQRNNGVGEVLKVRMNRVGGKPVLCLMLDARCSMLDITLEDNSSWMGEWRRVGVLECWKCWKVLVVSNLIGWMDR